MQNNNNMNGNSLLVVITNKEKGSEILNYTSELGIHGASAFRAYGTVPNRILKLLELVEVQKEIIMIALPSRYENDVIDRLTARFHFDRPNKGIIFSISLSGIFGSSHFESGLSEIESINHSPFQVVMTIVDKGQTDRILDYIEEQGFPRGTVIDAHGSANKSNVFLNLMLEPEKDIILTITTTNQAHKLAHLLENHLNLKTANSGILAILNLKQVVGVTHILKSAREVEDAMLEENKPGYSAIFAIVEDDKDEAVIQSAELAGSTGGTIIHARGSCPYHENNIFTRGVEPEREIVMIIAEDNKIHAICSKINEELQLDQPGKGILLVVPLYDTIGLVPGE